MKWLALLAILMLALSGCSGDADEPGEPQEEQTGAEGDLEETETEPTPDGGQNAEEPASEDDVFIPRGLNFSADQTSGFAPLDVIFNVSAEGNLENVTYRLAHGDGTDQSGNASDLPAMLNHTYAVGGAFDAIFEVAFHNETLSRNITITVDVEDVQTAPEITHWEFGPSLGCAGDFLEIADAFCISYDMGPSGETVDGHWLALDERYWGLSLTSDVTQSPTGPVPTPVGNFLADSDCVFTDDAHAIIGEGNNGADPCAATIPEGTAFLFIYPYGTPATDITVDVA